MADGSGPDPVRRKKRRRRLVWLVVLLGLVGLGYLATRPPTIHPGTVLTLRIGGALPESAPDNPVQALLRAASGGGGGDAPLNLHDLRRVLQHARRDGRIRGVALEISPLSAGWAKVEEVRDLIVAVRAAGKPVHALLTGDFIQEKEYLLGAAADRVVASPESGLLLNGLVAEVMFYRGVFDRVGVAPQFLQFKEYKSAAEPFINKAMSPAMREVIRGMLQGINDRFVKYVAERRKIDEAALRALMDRGGQTTAEALAAKLLDGVGYRDEVEGGLRQPGGDTHDRVASGGRYRSAIGDDPALGQVALIYAVGPITAGSEDGGLGQSEVIEGPRLARAVREAANDSAIKAIVLRVDSPGGSAVGSDYVWREVERARARKPVVVSMSDVAGSGGYWISMAASAIVAQPSTLTGSIGVVYGSFNVLPPLAWAGVTVDTEKFGANADLLSPYRSRSPEQLERISGWMQQVYTDFVGKVARGRQLDPKVVEPLAHGRVWLGSEAQPRKLVDQLGGLELALRIAREKAGLKEDLAAEPVLFPKHRGVMAALAQAGASVSALDGGVAADPLVALPRALQRLLRELGTARPYVVAPTLDIH